MGDRRREGSDGPEAIGEEHRGSNAVGSLEQLWEKGEDTEVYTRESGPGVP